MKRMILALTLLVICFSLCTASYFMLEKRADALIEDLQSAAEYIENKEYKNAAASLEKCSKRWEKDQTVFSIFLNHHMIENLSIDLPSLLPLLQKEKYDITLEKTEECINEIMTVVEEQKISIGNIL